jgi:hypothetical protein
LVCASSTGSGAHDFDRRGLFVRNFLDHDDPAHLNQFDVGTAYYW